MTTSAEAHSASCATIFPRSQYDKACPKCAIIFKVVMLRRKRVSLGCSLGEQQAAERIATNLCERYALRPADVLDREYAKQQAASQAPEQAKAQSRKRGYDTSWQKHYAQPPRGQKWKHYDDYSDVQ